ncbi:MAG: amino acid adenylation domain-containing protein [Lachnospiraceae bacterium]|jgi:D-alanine--poly(phosphoribitol) ligase subunit 1
MITNILTYLENSAEHFPMKTAFEEPETACTFRELQDASMKLGAWLIKYGVEGKKPIPVFMEKGITAIKTMMGIVRAGAFYVMLDVGQPLFRIKQIIDTLEPEIFITTGDAIASAGGEDFFRETGYSRNVIYAEDIPEIYGNLSGQKSPFPLSDADRKILRDRRETAKDTDPLYGIFTSGSTGVPKCVLVSHRSTVDFIEHFTEMFGFSDDDVIGNQAPWDFDVSVKDIYAGLKTGASIAIIPKKYFSIPTKLLDYLEEKNVTSLTWAVSALCIIPMLHGFDYKVPGNIRRIMFSGESMPVKHLNEWRRNVPDAMYVNLYGPTEITCNCTYYILDREYETGDSVPIGRSFPNETVFLLDENDMLVKGAGNIGEICVTGTALALGYYNNPGQTKKAFVQNPLNKAYPERMYRTGDLGYFDEEGMLHFSSRKDFQIKHMGHRIELGEIETAMERVEEVVRGCCIFDAEKNRIVGYYQGDIEKGELKKKMGAYLPAFMLPNRFVRVSTMPLTKNGKIDRATLKTLKKDYEI